MAETTANQQHAINGNAMMPDFRGWLEGQSHAVVTGHSSIAE